MGRPRLHDEETRKELLQAAEALVARGGSESLSLRRLAEAAGTSTRAVYSIFGSKEALFSALYRQSFLELIRIIENLPMTEDPARDLVRIGIDGFRRYALEHPNLFRLVFERIVPDSEPGPDDVAVARAALEHLYTRARRCARAGLLGGRSPELVASMFHCLCQGLASNEMRTGFRGLGDPVEIWEEALGALISGLEQPAATRRKRAGKKK